MLTVVAFFFFNDTATTEIYTLSLHDALPIFNVALPAIGQDLDAGLAGLQWTVNGYTLTLAAFILLGGSLGDRFGDRKSTRLNSSHANISYAVFCLKKKKTHQHIQRLSVTHTT